MKNMPHGRNVALRRHLAGWLCLVLGLAVGSLVGSAFTGATSAHENGAIVASPSAARVEDEEPRFLVGTKHPDFLLPSLTGDPWYQLDSFQGRPVVFVHFAAWSPACRRLLPLWCKQLQPARDRGELEVVVVVHDHHREPARWFLQSQQIDVPAIHDPLHTLLPTELPWGVVVDATGLVRQDRLILNRVEQELSEILSQTPQVGRPTIGSESRPPLGASPPPLEQLQRQFEQRLATPAPFSRPVQEAADGLLLAAHDQGGAARSTAWPLVVDYYHRAWDATGHADWAWRLATAHRFQFDVSHGQDAEAFQVAQTFAGRAGQAAPATWVGRGWRNEFGPQIEKTHAAYDWLPAAGASTADDAPPRNPRGLMAAQTLGPLTVDQAARGLLGHLPAPPSPVIPPLPWQSIEVAPIWVMAGENLLGSGGERAHPGTWARLYLQVKLKRGFRVLEDLPHWRWTLGEQEQADQPQWTPFSLSLLPTADSPTPLDPTPQYLWLEADVWFPEPGPRRASSLEQGQDGRSGTVEPESPPRRNATLFLRGLDSMTQRVEWRQIQFFLPPPFLHPAQSRIAR
jgi:peroxiredoxin